MVLDDEQLELARSHLLSSESTKLIRFMHCKSLSRSTSKFSEKTVRAGFDLGWISNPGGQLTDLGIFAADSCREYQLWQERNKKLPFEGAALPLDYFKGKSVIEIGSGMGGNLMSLSGVASRVCGVEPIKTYSQLGRIFCEREGRLAPKTRLGNAESLPFKDDEADLILCVSAHQYFDICPAFDEISRVLKPGGELLIIGGTFQRYFRDSLKKILLGQGGTKSVTLTIVNTLSYVCFKRRLFLGRQGFSTSRPIYPTCSAIERWLNGAGLFKISATCEIESETFFHLRRR